MGEGETEARGEPWAGEGACEAEWAAGCEALQALRQPAVPAARASRKSRRCMGETFSNIRLREHQATRGPNNTRGDGSAQVSYFSSVGTGALSGFASARGVVSVESLSQTEP